MKILIVDDEPYARKKIISFLKKEKTSAVLLEAEDGEQAVRMIEEQRPELVILDIQMPKMNGFEVIGSVGIEKMPLVIFTTAYDQYAVAAFEVKAIDYLLKPFEFERFQRAFQRAREQLQTGQDNKDDLKRLLLQVSQQKEYLQRLMVKQGERYSFIATREIIYLEADGKYVRIHSAGRRHLIRETLGMLEERLDPGKFTRIHRSFIVNLEFIKEIQPTFHGDCLVIMKNDARLRLSRHFRDRLFSWKPDRSTPPPGGDE